jgi:hypothetical protein
MSGISEIKKKAKLSIDEMYDSQSVGKMDNQKEGKPESKQTIQPASQLENKPDTHPTGSPSFQEISQSLNNKAGHTTIHQNGKLETNPDVKQETQTTRPTTIFPTTKQQIQKIQTYKMTFNLTEDIYKAFNDLYANRMLQGRKTEKSEMICEAIQWLIKMEEEQQTQ